MTYAKKTLSEIKLIHGDYGNFIKGQKLDKKKEKKYKMPPYQDLAASNEIDGEPLDEKCWPGYEKKGMKTMFGKRYPNCVKKKKTRKEDFSDWRSEFEQIDEKKMTKAQIKKRDEIADAISTREMNKRYGDKNVKYAIATKLAMKEDNIQEILDKKDVPHVKKLVGKLRKGSKTHAKQADDLEKALKEEPLTKQSLDARKKAQKNVEDKMNQQDSITTVNRKNGKMTSMNFTGGKRKDLFAKQLKKADIGVKMDADGLVPNAGAVVQKQAEKGMNIARKAMKDKPSKISDKQRKDFKTADNYLKSGNIERDINRKIPGTQQYRLDIGADEVNLGAQKYKPKKNKGFKFGIQKEDITDEALTIQDWNVDDIKFTEIETVDIIKAKPLKENVNLEEGIKRKIIKKLAKKIAKQLGKNKPKITGDVKTGLPKYVPPSKEVVQNIQTKSIVNQVKKASDLSSKPVKGTKPVKVNVSKPINFDKYFGGSPTKSVKKKFGSSKPTGTFTDDAPKVKRETLIKAKPGEAEATEKLIRKYEIGDKIEKKYPGRENANLKKKMYKRLFGESNWREELGEDWQKVNRKDKTDGLSRKAVKAYRRENPGSKLQTAVTKDPKKLKKGSKSAKRRLSFCRRMKGMKKRLTSAKTARDPNSRINKALRRWNC